MKNRLQQIYNLISPCPSLQPSASFIHKPSYSFCLSRRWLFHAIVALLGMVLIPEVKAQVIISDPVTTRDYPDSDTIVVDTLHVDSNETVSPTLPWEQRIRHELNRLLTADMFHTSQVGLLVFDLDADSVLFAYNEKQTMRPASTQKLVTAITAIDKLGGSYRFVTDLCYTGKIENKTLIGDIYCVGGFDPRFNADDMNAFVESIQKMGIDTIRGTIYADKGMKDDDRLGEGWCWDDDNPVLSPLLFSRKDVFIDRFVRELRDAGVVVEAMAGLGSKPGNAFCINTRFHTIDQVLMRMLKESDNLYAESMFYQLGAVSGNRPATARHAKNYVHRLIEKVGLKPSHYRIADGSGLSLYNYLTPDLLVKLLRYAYNNSNISLHLMPALPIAGVDGTLKYRMRGTYTKNNVRAKTGTLTGVSSLAGYCTASNGHKLCFAIINQGVLHANNARAFQDRVCTILCKP